MGFVVFFLWIWIVKRLYCPLGRCHLLKRVMSSCQVVEECNKRTEEIAQMTVELEEKKKELDDYRQNISQVLCVLVIIAIIFTP